MAERATLSLRHINNFITFAKTQGYAQEDTEGEYEILRLRKGNKPPLLFYARLSASEHASYHQEVAHSLVRAFVRHRRAVRRETYGGN